MSDIVVHICENDNNGKRSGFVHQFMFYYQHDRECFLHLECKTFDGVPIKEFANRIIQMYDIEFKFGQYGDWAGNMMWNQYDMPAPYALGLINLLCRKGDFTISEAERSIARKWDKGEEITAFDIGINDKTVVQEVIDPNQLKLF